MLLHDFFSCHLKTNQNCKNKKTARTCEKSNAHSTLPVARETTRTYKDEKIMHNFKRRYKIECAQRVSGITITRYDYSQNMWKPDNLQSLRAIVFKVLAVLPKNRNRSSFITTIPTNWARELDDSIVGLGIESFQGHCIFT